MSSASRHDESAEDWIVQPEDCRVPEPTHPKAKSQEPEEAIHTDPLKGESRIDSFALPPNLVKWIFPEMFEDDDTKPDSLVAPPPNQPHPRGQQPSVTKKSQFYQRSRVVHGGCTYWTMNSNVDGEVRHRAFRQCRGTPKEVLVSGKPLGNDAVWRPMTKDDQHDF